MTRSQPRYRPAVNGMDEQTLRHVEHGERVELHLPHGQRLHLRRTESEHPLHEYVLLNGQAISAAALAAIADGLSS